MFALFHVNSKDSSSNVRLRSEELAEELVALCAPGDSLHVVPDELCSDATALLSELTGQIKRGDFIHV